MTALYDAYLPFSLQLIMNRIDLLHVVQLQSILSITILLAPGTVAEALSIRREPVSSGIPPTEQ